MIEVIKKTFKVENEELVAYGRVEDDGDDYEIEIVFEIRGEIECENGFSPDLDNLDIDIISMTAEFDGNTIYVEESFDLMGVKEEIKDNLEFDEDYQLFEVEDISLQKFLEKNILN